MIPKKLAPDLIRACPGLRSGVEAGFRTRSRSKGYGGHDETPPPEISASGCWRCHAAGPAAPGMGASLSVATGALGGAVSARRSGRNSGAVVRAIHVGALGTALRDREPSWRRRQYRHRG